MFDDVNPIPSPRFIILIDIPELVVETLLLPLREALGGARVGGSWSTACLRHNYKL